MNSAAEDRSQRANVPREILYLSGEDIAAIAPTIFEVIDALKAMFYEKAQGRVEMPSKLGVHPVDGAFIDAMPAFIPALQSAGLKWVSVYPRNPERGLPHTSGLIVVNDPVTGLAVAILDGGWITAARTAGASALAAQYLARPESSVLGILGCGVQGQTHIQAFAAAFPIKHVLAYDIRPEAVDRCAEEMGNSLGIAIEAVDSPREVVEAVDILVTAGPITRPPHATIKEDWAARGLFATSVDYSSYWSSDALAQFDRVVTDDLLQFMVYRSVGYCEGMAVPDCELASLITGACPGRRSSSERAFCCNLGLAAADIAVANLVIHRASKRGIGSHLRR